MMPKTETSALRAHQLALLQMLHEIDRVCKKHHIPYYIYTVCRYGAGRRAAWRIHPVG